jgi:hypothetical protein
MYRMENGTKTSSEIASWRILSCARLSDSTAGMGKRLL